DDRDPGVGAARARQPWRHADRGALSGKRDAQESDSDWGNDRGGRRRPAPTTLVRFQNRQAHRRVTRLPVEGSLTGLLVDFLAAVLLPRKDVEAEVLQV